VNWAGVADAASDFLRKRFFAALGAARHGPKLKGERAFCSEA
jgi:hypothetical protein